METLKVIGYLLMVTSGHSLSREYGTDERKPCASFYCSKDFKEPIINLAENPECSDLAHLNSDVEVLKITASLQVEPGCSLTACNQLGFKGTCVQFTNGSFTLPHHFGTVLSLNCSCWQMGINKAEIPQQKLISGKFLPRTKRDACGLSGADDDEILAITGRDLSLYFSQQCQEEIRRRQMEIGRGRGGTAGGGGCLKEGTMILMADLTEKPIQLLEVGDSVMDHNLSPVKVGGVLKKFLMQDSFHGFDNQTFFFTDTHQIVGRTLDSHMQIYAKDLTKTIEENPLLAYLEVRQLPETSEILYYDSSSNSVETETGRVYTDPTEYAETTFVYIILIESEIGTYIANGFVCRHEIPPMEHWPNTMSLLFSLVSESEIRCIEVVPYTIDAIKKIGMIVNQGLVELVEGLKDIRIDMANTSAVNRLDMSDRVIADIFSKPTFSAFATEVYGKLGPMLAKYIDFDGRNSEQELQVNQMNLYNKLKVHFVHSIKAAFGCINN